MQAWPKRKNHFKPHWGHGKRQVSVPPAAVRDLGRLGNLWVLVLQADAWSAAISRSTGEKLKVGDTDPRLATNRHGRASALAGPTPGGQGEALRAGAGLGRGSYPVLWGSPGEAGLPCVAALLEENRDAPAPCTGRALPATSPAPVRCPLSSLSTTAAPDLPLQSRGLPDADSPVG